MKSEFEIAVRTSESWKVPDVMATIGPTLEKPIDLRRAIQAGAHWFRFPCGYRQRPHLENARAVRKAATQLRIPIQLLLDLPSSRPRTGSMPELKLSVGERVLFCDPEVSDNTLAPEPVALIPLPGLVELLPKLRPRHRMWFCDGRLSFVVEELQPAAVVARLEKGTIPLKSSNSLFLPDSQSAFSVFTAPDRELLAAMAAAKLRPDWVALSLIGSAADVRAGRKEIRTLLGSSVRVMAKFETVAAVDSAAEIMREALRVMLAQRPRSENGQRGVILNMASILGIHPEPRNFSAIGYAAAKGGIIAMTRTAAAFYAQNKIRINAIAPALIQTPMSARASENRTILKFITRRFGLEPLPGLRPAMGDLTGALQF